MRRRNLFLLRREGRGCFVAETAFIQEAGYIEHFIDK